jgi:hypothetical protein
MVEKIISNRRLVKSSLPVARALLKRLPHARLFPLERGTKDVPLIDDNLKRANNSILWCEKQHARHPFCNWGLALPGGDILVIDVDTKPGKCGEGTLFDLEMKHGDLPATLTVQTPSGGRHLYFRCPPGHKAQFALGKNGLGPDIDLPNYVVVAGCIVDGKPYTITNDVRMAVAPEWIWTEYLDKKRERETVEQAPIAEVDQQSEIDWFIHHLKFDAKPSIEGEGGEKALLDVFGVAKDHGLSIETAIELVDEHYNVAPTCDPLWLVGEGPEADRLDIKARNAYTYLVENAPGQRTPEFEFSDDELPPLTADEITLAAKRQRERRGELEPLDETPPEPTTLASTPKPTLAPTPTPSDKPPSDKPAKIDVDWVCANWVWVVGIERFILRTNTEKVWNRKQFDSQYNYLTRASSISGELFKAKDRIRRYHTVRYQPGADETVANAYNLWRPSAIKPAKGNTSLWDALFELLFPNERDRDAVLNWLAWVYQNPGKKPHQALLIVGKQTGTGKSLIARIMEQLIGPANTQRPKNSSLKGDFNGWAAQCKLCIIEELMQIGRREVANELRDLITEPTCEINIKNVPAFKIDSYMAMMAISNHDDALPVEVTDRRWLIIETMATAAAPEFYERLCNATINYGVINEAGLAAVAYQLAHRDLKGYKPVGSAMMTEAKAEMIDLNATQVERWLNDNRMNPPLNGKVVTIRDITEAMPMTSQRDKSVETTTIKFVKAKLKGARLGYHRVGGHVLPLWAINGAGPLVGKRFIGGEHVVTIYQRERASWRAAAEVDTADDFGI